MIVFEFERTTITISVLLYNSLFCFFFSKTCKLIVLYRLMDDKER